MTSHCVVSEDEWHESRKQLLAKEKELSRQIDQIAQQRRELPWTKVEKQYLFETESGRKTLAELFDGKSQLIIYHFMFGPEWEEGCVGCSFVSDHFDGVNLHLTNHDVSLVVASRAPLEKFQSFKKRMGWNFPWVSSAASDFNFDFHVSFTKEEIEAGTAYYNYQLTGQVMDEMQGLSVFYKDEKGKIFHTYSTYARGLDLLLGAHNFLDLTPVGRNEKTTMDWVRHHDKYTAGEAVTITGERVSISECCASEGHS